MKQKPINIQIYEYLNDRFYVLDGIGGFFKHDFLITRYPIEGEVKHMLRHRPSYHGKLHPHYKEMYKKLGDDWESDMTNSDRLVDIAVELGFKYEPDEPRRPIDGDSERIIPEETHSEDTYIRF